MSLVAVVGMGPEGWEGLDAAARQRVGQADRIYGSERLLNLCPEMRGQRVVFRTDLARVGDELRAHLDRRQVVLATGDPNFFGIAEFLYRTVGREQVEVLPAVSSVQLAFARVRLSWHDAVFRSVHGRPVEPVVEWARQFPKLAILTDPVHHAGVVAERLASSGLESLTMHVGERLGTAAERVVSGTPGSLRGRAFDGFSVVVLCHPDTMAPARTLGFGIDDAWFERAGGGELLTKKEVRAVSLAALDLRPGQVVWDIGAGTGSVAIEAAFLVGPAGRVFAIERQLARVAAIENNVRRSGRQVTVIAAQAPAGVESLPSPDRVFVGGSGGNLVKILEYVCAHVTAFGRVVLNLVGLEQVAQVVAMGRTCGWQTEVAQVSVSRSVKTGEVIRLAALNPVFVVTLLRGEDGS
ncbi:MAG: precorrin-6y C5,15-methyltransferase (decarboxylating) subunit CbiE [Thermaerobacter sp.]|nr:precorrin-6y C5,15-methyltransferase (decarboxylating) subunit CbiE [Thermaerobacter sp.]